LLEVEYLSLLNSSVLTDYSVLVENVPGNATRVEEWIDFFKSLGPLEEHGGKVADVTIALNNGRSILSEIGIYSYFISWRR
jgi:hypothetical protein